MNVGTAPCALRFDLQPEHPCPATTVINANFVPLVLDNIVSVLSKVIFVQILVNQLIFALF